MIIIITGVGIHDARKRKTVYDWKPYKKPIPRMVAQIADPYAPEIIKETPVVIPVNIKYARPKKKSKTVYLQVIICVIYIIYIYT